MSNTPHTSPRTLLSSSPERDRLIRQAGYASVIVALLIIVIKSVAWLETDSLSLLSSLVDSSLDVLTSIINMLAIRYALQPPDEDHRFGHGKAEDIAGLAQSAFIAGSAFLISSEAFIRFFHPHPLERGFVGIVAMVASMLLTLALLAFQRYVIRRTASNVIEADSLHYFSDVVVNASIIIVLVASTFFQGLDVLDPILALVISAYIFITAWKVGRKAFDRLMDKEFNEDERDKIKEVVLLHPQSRGMHDLKTRYSGGTAFIQLHLELDSHLTLLQAHTISDEVEEALLKVFPGAEITIHQDIDHPQAMPLQHEQIKSV